MTRLALTTYPQLLYERVNHLMQKLSWPYFGGEEEVGIYYPEEREGYNETGSCRWRDLISLVSWRLSCVSFGVYLVPLFSLVIVGVAV